MHINRTITLDPETAGEWARLDRDIAARALIANRADDAALRDAARAEMDALTEQRDALKPTVDAAARRLTITRLSPKKWARLTLEHPPRPGDPYDERMGFNTDTFDGPLMAACITEAVDGTGKPAPFDWDTAAEEMAFADYQSIITATIGLHQERDAVPFSPPALAPDPT